MGKTGHQRDGDFIRSPSENVPRVVESHTAFVLGKEGHSQ